MRKILTIFSAALLLASCGVGNQSVSGGKPDEARISVSIDQKPKLITPVTVTIDGKDYTVTPAYKSKFKAKTDIKTRAYNSLVVTPGKHQVTVSSNGKQLYSKSIFISAAEHRIIEIQP